MAEASGSAPKPQLRFISHAEGQVDCRHKLVEVLRSLHHLSIDDAGQLHRFDRGRWWPVDESWTWGASYDVLQGKLRGHLSQSFVSAVHGSLKARQPFLEDRPPSGKINLSGTVLDILTGTTHPACFDNWPSTTCMPIQWNPEAKTAPRWLAYLESIIPPDALTYTLELIASCMVSDVFSQKIIWLAGEGGNGKGTFLLALRQLIGEENVAAVSFKTLSSDRFAMAQVKGKLLVIDGDSSLAQIKESSTLKQLSAHDVVYAQEKYGRPFGFRPYAKIIVAANGKPNSRDISEGFFDRPEIFPMDRRLRGTDKERLQNEILAELEAESSGFMNILLPHLKNLFLRRKFQVPPSIRDATEAFKADAHPMAAFFEECMELDPEGTLDEVELRRAQHEWADQNGLAKLNRDMIYSWLKTHHPGVSHARPGQRGTPRVKKYTGIRFI